MLVMVVNSFQYALHITSDAIAGLHKIAVHEREYQHLTLFGNKEAAQTMVIA
jgi:hypothetical protein